MGGRRRPSQASHFQLTAKHTRQHLQSWLLLGATSLPLIEQRVSFLSKEEQDDGPSTSPHSTAVNSGQPGTLNLQLKWPEHCSPGLCTCCSLCRGSLPILPAVNTAHPIQLSASPLDCLLLEVRDGPCASLVSAALSTAAEEHSPSLTSV